MQIFICWSKERSNKLAKLMQDWLPKVLPGLAAPFFSEDIEKGARWSEVLQGQLKDSQGGLICLTPENVSSPWLHYEAGMLANSLGKNQSRIYTLLYRLEPGQLSSPLGAYQHTRCTKEDMRRLVDAIAQASKPPLKNEFETHWKEFEQRHNAIAPLTISDLIPELERLFQRKTFNEPLDECSRQAWVERYTGAAETLAALRQHRQRISDIAPPFILYWCDELIAQLDGYKMDMSALLLREVKFEFKDSDVKLDIKPGIGLTCERRRKQIKHLALQLLMPNSAPVLDASLGYAKLNTLEEKKSRLIHPWQEKLKAEAKEKNSLTEKLEKCPTSLWEFDRIAYYLYRENATEPDVTSMRDDVERELERAQARDQEGSLVPLHYAVRAWQKHLTSSTEHRQETVALVQRVNEFLAQDARRDQGNQIKRRLDEIKDLFEKNSTV